MAQFSGFYGIHDRISIAQCGVVTEADEDFLYVLVFGIAAEFQCLLYDGAKILFTVSFLPMCFTPSQPTTFVL